MVYSGDWELVAMATQSSLGSLPCLWVLVEPCLPPKKLSQLGIADFSLIMMQPLLILASQSEYEYSQKVCELFLLDFIL